MKMASGQERQTLAGMDVVILVGGLGTRLRGLFPDTPKCLAPINGTPFLQHMLAGLIDVGARRIILAVGYKAGAVEDYVRKHDWREAQVVCSLENAPLGTGGALRQALPLIHSDTVLVQNGDSHVEARLFDFVEFHRQRQARLSLLLTHQADVSASGRVLTDARDAVLDFAEKPGGAGEGGGYINAGVYLMQRDVVAEIPEASAAHPVSLERDVFPRWVGRGFFALKGRFPFIDIGTPDNYRRAARFFPANTSSP